MKMVKRSLSLLLILAMLFALAGCVGSYPMRAHNHCLAHVAFYDEPVDFAAAKTDHHELSEGRSDYITRSETNKLRRYVNSVREWQELSQDEMDDLKVIGHFEIAENSIGFFFLTEDGGVCFSSGNSQYLYGKLSDRGAEFVKSLKP